MTSSKKIINQEIKNYQNDKVQQRQSYIAKRQPTNHARNQQQQQSKSGKPRLLPTQDDSKQKCV